MNQIKGSTANKKEIRKYQSKLERVIYVLENMQVSYEDWRNEIYCNVSPSYSLARENAEKILSLFGINKPKNYPY